VWVVAGGQEQGCGGVGTDAVSLWQLGFVGVDGVGDPLVQLVDLAGEFDDPVRMLMTAATWMSLCVSTPRITSGEVSSWPVIDGWDMPGTAVPLLTAREADGCRRAGRDGQDCDGALVAARPLSGHVPLVQRQQAPPWNPSRQIKLKTPKGGECGCL
jgi:hypothetical protein